MRHEPDLYSPDIEWLLTEADAAIGYRSSLGSQIATLERGGQSGNYDPSCADPYTDYQVSSPKKPGCIDRYRRLSAAWNAIGIADRNILSARYTAHFRVQVRTQQGGFGYSGWPHGVEAALGDLAGVVLMQASGDSLAKVLTACGKSDLIFLAPWLKRARESSRRAHRAFRVAKRSGWMEGVTDAA